MGKTDVELDKSIIDRVVEIQILLDENKSYPLHT